jgi:hypothetical protein
LNLSATNGPACTIELPKLHRGQVEAYAALRPHRFKALRSGRRFGKTELAKVWIAQGLARGQECAWLAPQHMTWSEVYVDMLRILGPIVAMSTRTPGVIRLQNGGRLDFFSLENSIVGRGRRYHRIVIDEAAFTKGGDNRADDSMMAIWEKALKPTLFDFGGEAMICSNSAGKDPDNFFYNICNDPQYGFHEYHATTLDNPFLPKKLWGESAQEWEVRRARFHAELNEQNDPLVYAQEYLADFVDWSGAAFFSREKLLVDGKPAEIPSWCDCVFAVIDTASKTGTDNDATNSPKRFARRAVRSARLSRTRTPGRSFCNKLFEGICRPEKSSRNSPPWARMSARSRSPGTFTRERSNTLSARSTRRPLTKGKPGTISSSRSSPSESGTEKATERTICLTPSATASLSR